MVSHESKTRNSSGRGKTARGKSQLQVEKILEGVSDSFVALDTEWRYTYVNEKAAQTFGRTREQLIGKHIWTEFPEGVGQPFYKAYYKAVETQQPIFLEEYYPPYDRWFENRIYPSRDGLSIFFHDITDRKKAELGLREAREQLALAVHSANVGLWDWDLTTNKVYFSPEWKSQIGYGEDEISNDFSEWESRVHPDDLERAKATVSGYIEKPYPNFQNEFRLRHKDGSYRWILSQASLVTNEEGDPIHMIGSHIDITERKKAEILMTGEKKILEMIARGETLYQILDAITRNIETQSRGLFCTILLLDSDGIHVRHGAAPSMPETFVRAIDGQPIGPRAGSCGTAAYRREPVYVSDIASDPLWTDYREVALKHGLRACWSTPIMTSNDRVLGTFAMYYGEPRSPEQSDLHLIELATHLTEIAIVRKRAEERLESQARLLELSYDGILVWELDGAITFWNRGAEAMYGFSAPEAVGQVSHTLLQTRHPQGYEVFRSALEKQGTWTGEVTHTTRSGHSITVETRHQLVDFPDGRTMVLETNRDITDRKRAESDLRESEEQFRATFDQAAVGVAQVATDGGWLKVNQKLCDIVGYTREELLTKTFQDITHPDDLESDLGYVKQMLAGGIKTYSMEKRYFRKGGSTVWVNLTVSLVRAADGAPKYFISVVEDISGRKQAEAEIQKLNAELEQRVVERTAQLQAANKDLESFSYSVSHDLRAPLRAISGFASILARRHRADLNEEGRHYLDNVVQASERMGLLIDDLLQYARVGRQGIRRNSVPLAALIKEIGGNMKSRLDEIHGIIEIAEDLPVVLGDQTLLTQIFTNLLENAITYHKPDAPPQVKVGWRSEGTRVLVEVSDNGIGIPAEYQEKIFNMFQRLHSEDDYPGTGIGLATVKKCVELLGGELGVESTVGAGSTFWVKLQGA